MDISCQFYAVRDIHHAFAEDIVQPFPVYGANHFIIILKYFNLDSLSLQQYLCGKN